MIRIEAAPPPASFDARVRQPGLSAIAEMVGEPSSLKRRGPKRAQIADRREALPASCFPRYWTLALADLEPAYSGICAFCCLFIEPGTGDRTVDHMVPKSRAWDLVYEWSNYRLACGQMNSSKGEELDVLDPLTVEEGWFALEFVTFQVIPGPNAEGTNLVRVRETIARLKLDRWTRISRQIKQYWDEYSAGRIGWEYLSSRAPFLAAEMRRQNRLGDRDRSSVGGA